MAEPREGARMYGRLVRFVRPYWWLMAGNVLCSLIAAGLEVFSFTLLVPFLNALFGKTSLGCQAPAADVLDRLQQHIVCAFLDTDDKLASIKAVIIAILAITLVKN